MSNFKRTFLPALLMAMVLRTIAIGADIDVYFSPNGGAATAVAREIYAAKLSVHVMAYSISESQVTRAIIGAKDRGLSVFLIVDKHQQGGSFTTARKIKDSGVPVRVDRNHALMHNKTVVIDGTTVVTGSMNFSASGDKKNAENTIILRDADVARKYESDFQSHLSHSTTYSPPTLPLSSPDPPTQKEP